MIYYTEFGLTDVEIESMLALRKIARQEKDFQVADSLRENIQRHHITIEDRPDGSTYWYKFRRYI